MVAVSPEFDAAELARNLKAKPAVPDPEPAVPLELTPAAPVADGMVHYLAVTPVPAVGVIGYGSVASLSTALQAFAGTGVYARGNLGREEIRATVVTVDREPIGRYLLTVDGQRYVRPDAFSPPAGSDKATALRWLTDAVTGLRSTTNGAILVVLSEACELSVDELTSVAIEADCLVAVQEHRLELVHPVWEPRLLPAKPAPVAEPAPELRRPSAVARAAQAKGGVSAWLARVPELVQGYPEAIPGPHGERVAVAYGQRDLHGREHVALSATTERPDGRVVPMELELVPGVLVALEDIKVFV